MYRNTIRSVIFPLVIAVAVAAGVFIGSFWNRDVLPEPGDKPRVSRGRADNNKISYTLSLIERMYLDPVNLDSLAEGVLPVLFGELDPHSAYIPARQFADVNEVLDGEFDGIGVVFNMSTDTIIVLNVLPGGPSEKAGIQNGDRIVRIGDSLVAGQKIPQNDVVKMLRGKRGTTVDLKLQRNGIAQLVPVTVERGIIPLKSIDASFMITDDIAFVKLLTFSKNSITELATVLERLRKQGMTKLIFDLRGNTGGFLDQAIHIANEFLPANRLIVYTEDRNKRRVEEFSNGSGRYTDIDLVILIDEISASSSEILAGAIQDNDRGTVIGRRSFGKGLVQQQIPFQDGSAIRLTVARYFTPTGRSIQKPYENGALEEYGNDLRNRAEHNELFTADSIRFADSLRFITAGGKVVYGGGGIMPDIFIPLDTTAISRYYIEVSGRNILYRYTLEYADRHRNELNNISTVQELDRYLSADTRLLDDFIAYASAQGVKPVRGDINHSRELLTAQLRAYIGRNTQLSDSGFYSNIYRVDPTVLKAIDFLDRKEE